MRMSLSKLHLLRSNFVSLSQRHSRTLSTTLFLGQKAATPSSSASASHSRQLTRVAATRSLSFKRQPPLACLSTFPTSLRDRPRPAEGKQRDDDVLMENDDERKLSLSGRLKQLFADYWKITLVVHCVNCSLWFIGAIALVHFGLDVPVFLSKLHGWLAALNAPSKLLALLTHAQLGFWAAVFLLYKLSLPLRYLITVVGTRQSIAVLRQVGWLPPLKQKDRLRNMMREGGDNVKERVQNATDNIKERVQDTKDNLKERVQDTKDNLKERVQDATDHTRHRVKSKIDGARDNLPPSLKKWRKKPPRR